VWFRIVILYRLQIKLLIDWLIDWLIVGWTDRSIDRSIDWLIDWLIDIISDWLTWQHHYLITEYNTWASSTLSSGSSDHLNLDTCSTSCTCVASRSCVTFQTSRSSSTSSTWIACVWTQFVKLLHTDQED